MKYCHTLHYCDVCKERRAKVFFLRKDEAGGNVYSVECHGRQGFLHFSRKEMLAASYTDVDLIGEGLSKLFRPNRPGKIPRKKPLRKILRGTR